MTNEREFWKKRSVNYDKLEWVSKPNIIQSLMTLGNFTPDDVVLDIGCGTGKIISKISHIVKEVHGIDISPDMLEKIDTKKYPNVFLKVGDIRKIDYPENTFDKIVARLVLHHILDDSDLSQIMKECLRVLKPGGRMIISEGVPPRNDLKKNFEEIFKLKEERRTFLPEDLKQILTDAGFEYIRINVSIDEHMSVRNWLENAGDLDEKTIEKIVDMHRNSSDLFKSSYNLKDTGDDILIDVKVIIAIGTKPK